MNDKKQGFLGKVKGIFGKKAGNASKEIKPVSPAPAVTEPEEIKYFNTFEEFGTLTNFNSEYAGQLKNSNSIFVSYETEAVLLDESDIPYITDKFIEETKFCDIAIKVDYDMRLTPKAKETLNYLEAKLAKLGRRVYFVENILDLRNPDYTKYSLQTVYDANAKLDSLTQIIENAKINGVALSPLEKFMRAYELTVRYAPYKLENESSPREFSRQLSSILNPSKFDNCICCVGYSKLLSALCNRMGIPCLSIPEEGHKFYEKAGQARINHCTVRVYIKDDKYGVDGLFLSDPTNDSSNSSSIVPTLRHALCNYKEYVKTSIGVVNFFAPEKLLNGEILPSDYSSARAMIYETVEVDDKVKFYKRLGIMPSEEEVTSAMGKIRNEEGYKVLLHEFIVRVANGAKSEDLRKLDFKKFGEIDPLIKELYLRIAENGVELLQTEMQQVVQDEDHLQELYEKYNRLNTKMKLVSAGWKNLSMNAEVSVKDIIKAFAVGIYATSEITKVQENIATLELSLSVDANEMLSIALISEHENGKQIIENDDLKELLKPTIEAFCNATAVKDMNKYFAEAKNKIKDYRAGTIGQGLPIKFLSDDASTRYQKWNVEAFDKDHRTILSNEQIKDKITSIMASAKAEVLNANSSERE